MKTFDQESRDAVLAELEECADLLEADKIAGVFLVYYTSKRQVGEVAASTDSHLLYSYATTAKFRFLKTIIEKEDMILDAAHAGDKN